MPALSRSRIVHLDSHHERALAFVEAHASTRQPSDQSRLEHVTRMSALSPDTLDAVRSGIRQYARVCLHFHPDRPTPQGGNVLDGMLRTGHYRSQFSTGISNGSVTAHPGGARFEWESELFGGAYDREVHPDDRPVYGALDLLPSADGPSPRFGSCYFVLHPGVSQRSSLCYGDSHVSPMDRGTLRHLDSILAAVFEDSFQRESVLGVQPLRPPALVRDLLNLPTAERRRRANNLDYYIEAQVHGSVELSRDVASLHAESCFEGTPVGASLAALCERYDLSLVYRPARTLPVQAVPADFRGPEMPALARRICPGGTLTAYAIGRAANAPQAESLQGLKYLWHVLVRFGAAS